MRRADDSDRPSVLDLLADSLGWDARPEVRRALRLEARRNPFGPSAGVGCRRARSGCRLPDLPALAVRASRRPHPPRRPSRRRRDPRPRIGGEGIFRRLTLTAVDELIAEGVDFVFNTPNRESMAGNLALGWTTVGRVPIIARCPRAHDQAALTPVAGTGRAVAGLDQCRRGRERRARRPTRARPARGRRPTHRSAYGQDARVPALALRARHAGLPRRRDRRRSRGGNRDLSSAEAGRGDRSGHIGCDRAARRGGRAAPAAPAGRKTDRRRLRDRRRSATPRAGFLPFPRQGPILTWRRLADQSAPPRLRDLDLALGDVELL